MSERWIVENLHKGVRASYQADEVLFEVETGHQNLVIFKNETFGRMMSLDGITQVTQRDEFVYHEMMAHTPLMAHGQARKVLIIGGGDGGVLREVLRHDSVEKATMVEIDQAVVDMCVEYLPMISNGAFEDPRTNLVIADGAAFMKDPDDRYDVIIVDSTDPIGPGEVLFQDSFYGHARACLAPGGIIVTQNGVPFVQGDELANTMRAFKALFAHATCYQATIPTYVFGPMAMGWGTDNAQSLTVSVEEIEARFAKLKGKARYYTPQVHKGAFALPPYISELIE